MHIYDIELTKQILGDIGPLRFNPKVVKVCAGCKTPEIVRYRGRGKTKEYYCKKCVAARPEVKKKVSENTKKQWENEEFRELVKNNSTNIWKDPIRASKMSRCRTDAEVIKKIIAANKNRKYNGTDISKRMIELWKNKSYRDKMIEIRKAVSLELWKNEDYRNSVVDRMNKLWLDQDYRSRIVSKSITNWKNEDYKTKTINALRHPDTRLKIKNASLKTWSDQEYRNRIKIVRSSDEYRDKFRKLWLDPVFRSKVENITVSKLQILLYSILDDIGIQYFRERRDAPHDTECKIGPYSFDCVIPRVGKPTLLIECQGEYWHSLPRAIARDKSKASYISNNFPNQYELKCIWEHEFLHPNKIANLIKYWMGFENETIDYNVDDVIIKITSTNETKLLLSKYHYISSVGRHGVNFGAYLGDELIAVAIFSNLPRSNITFPNINSCEIRDLSRFCIHPKYQKKNFGSWFLSKCLKLLDKSIKLVVSYADTTFNHTGALYKSCNFKLDKVVDPDYWYVAPDGWVMHKKTLYNQAISMRMTESTYAELHDYVKVWGKEKLRYVYYRK